MIIAEINETIPNLPKPSAIPYMNPSVISDIYEMINKIIIVILMIKLQGNPPLKWWEELQQTLCLVKHYF